MDIFLFVVWRHLRLCNFEAAVKNCARSSRRGLFRAQRKQRLPIGCHISRKSRIALHLWFSCCISTWPVEPSSQRRHWQIIHFHHLLRLLWSELYSTAQKVLHSEVEARISLGRGCCIHDPVFACRQECRGNSEEENQSANLFLRRRHNSPGGQRVCSRITLGLARFLRSK